jgi:hypothetical protein
MPTLNNRGTMTSIPDFSPLFGSQLQDSAFANAD